MYYAEQIVLGAEDMKGVDFAPISERRSAPFFIKGKRRKSKMKSDSTTVIKNMEFLVKELHKEWDRSGALGIRYYFP